MVNVHKPSPWSGDRNIEDDMRRKSSWESRRPSSEPPTYMTSSLSNSPGSSISFKCASSSEEVARFLFLVFPFVADVDIRWDCDFPKPSAGLALVVEVFRFAWPAPFRPVFLRNAHSILCPAPP